MTRWFLSLHPSFWYFSIPSKPGSEPATDWPVRLPGRLPLKHHYWIFEMKKITTAIAVLLSCEDDCANSYFYQEIVMVGGRTASHRKLPRWNRINALLWVRTHIASIWRSYDVICRYLTASRVIHAGLVVKLFVCLESTYAKLSEGITLDPVFEF